jgi:osmoprotectant transport system substrate-binding protein
VKPTVARPFRFTLAIVALGAAIGLAGCGGTSASSSARSTSSVATTTNAVTLPGAGKPPITIGDKNFTEQFLLGELYMQALTAQGYSVSLNQNIGPTEVTTQALQSGTLDMYPEYLDVGWQPARAPWSPPAGAYTQPYPSERSAYRTAQQYALTLKLELLDATPFSDTNAIAVTSSYSAQNNVTTIADLDPLASTLTFGGPAEFQQSPDGLPAIERAYGFQPAVYKALSVGGQYEALDHQLVQAADVNSTDGQLANGSYALLSDPHHVFGWGNVVPVVPLAVLDREGPAFAATINRVSGLLTTTAMRQLNAAVDISGQDPKVVAEQFLTSHGLLPAAPGSS